MNWKDALNEIESVEFDIRINVVSSFRLFLNAARQEPAVIGLYQELQQSGEVAEEILGRVCELSQLSIDARYGHPADTTLAILLWMLSLRQRTYAEIAANYVESAKNCWYAWKMAKEVIAPVSVSGGDIGVSETGNAELMTVGDAEAPVNLKSFSRIATNISASLEPGLLKSGLAA